jgi:arsenate reductase
MNIQLQQILELPISDERKAVIEPLRIYLKEQLELENPIRLNFICTHNSRRSQFAQVWAHVAAHHYNLPIQSFSGGVEVTACNPRTVNALKTIGFRVESAGRDNPLYRAFFSDDAEPIRLFSKLYDDPENPQQRFAAIMTCSHADENCPYLPSADVRISLLYEDPKAFDDTAHESQAYTERSLQIASEMFYAFNEL